MFAGGGGVEGHQAAGGRAPPLAGRRRPGRLGAAVTAQDEPQLAAHLREHRRLPGRDGQHGHAGGVTATTNYCAVTYNEASPNNSQYKHWR